ncbi:hypothetical Cytosolic Protein [Bacillus sp. GeD10]|nr:hypothetical Cytosolic Protein [Bacillus sp. GeD10]
MTILAVFIQKDTFVFNHEDIEGIIFVGFIDEEEEVFVGLLN